MGWQEAPVVEAPTKPAGGGWQSAPIEAPTEPVALNGTVAPKAAEAAPGVSANVEWAPGQAPPPPDLLDRFLTSAAATANGLSASVPFLQNTTDAIGGTVAQLTGGDYDEFVNRQRGIRDQLAEEAPFARASGNALLPVTRRQANASPHSTRSDKLLGSGRIALHGAPQHVHGLLNPNIRL